MIPTSFPPAAEIARLTARALLEIKAVHFNAETPFTLASGLPSPTYIDCRKLISYPRIRSVLMDFLCATVLRDAGLEAFDNIAGGETAGIPFAALVAERLALPMTYVRKKPKGYGRNARIEGAMTPGAGRIEVGVRPENVRLVPPGTPGALQGTVRKVADLGHRAVVEAMIGTTRVAAITHGNLPAQGDTVHMSFDPTRTRVYRDAWIATTAGGAA